MKGQSRDWPGTETEERNVNPPGGGEAGALQTSRRSAELPLSSSLRYPNGNRGGPRAAVHLFTWEKVSSLFPDEV